MISFLSDARVNGSRKAQSSPKYMRVKVREKGLKENSVSSFATFNFSCFLLLRGCSIFFFFVPCAGILRPRQAVLEGDSGHDAYRGRRSSGGRAERSHSPLRAPLQRLLRPPSLDLCHEPDIFFHAQGEAR